jgi:hypothetical protein
VLKRPGRKTLAFGDTLRLKVTLDQDGGYAALAEFNSQANANRAPADNHNLITLCHDRSLLWLVVDQASDLPLLVM